MLIFFCFWRSSNSFADGIMGVVCAHQKESTRQMCKLTQLANCIRWKSIFNEWIKRILWHIFVLLIVDIHCHVLVKCMLLLIVFSFIAFELLHKEKWNEMCWNCWWYWSFSSLCQIIWHRYWNSTGQGWIIRESLKCFRQHQKL
jgi:hypothetical protein